jgi:ankyrin repeat protein
MQVLDEETRRYLNEARGLSALHIACLNYNRDQIAELLSIPQCNPSPLDRDGTTPLRMCVGGGLGKDEDIVIDIMSMLIQGGSDVRELDCDGRTLLHEIVLSDVMMNHQKLIGFLVEMGVPDSRDVGGMTASELARANIWDSHIGQEFSMLIHRLFTGSRKRQKTG